MEFFPKEKVTKTTKLLGSRDSVEEMFKSITSLPSDPIVFDIEAFKNEIQTDSRDQTLDAFLTVVKLSIIISELRRAKRTFYLLYIEDSTDAQQFLNNADDIASKICSVFIETYAPPDTEAVLRAGILGK